jgi:molybdenum cofactor biosynthesis protein MoaC
MEDVSALEDAPAQDSPFEEDALSRVTPQGGVQMVDVSARGDATRTALAAGRVRIGEEAFRQIEQETLKKGDVLTVAQIAGITGAKLTSRLIPLCHSVQINGVDLELSLSEEEDFAVEVRAFAKSTGPTGVEMEALTAVNVAALTVYDMCKSVTKEIEITDVRLLAKTGGQDGDYRREE